MLMLIIHSYPVLAQSSVVAITKNKIMTIDLEQSNKVIILNKGKECSKSLISYNKEKVAYQDQKSNLYLSSLINLDKQMKM